MRNRSLRLRSRFVGAALLHSHGGLHPQSLVARLYRARPGGPAAAASLRDSDVVIAVDGGSVTELSPHAVRFLIASRHPGTTVKVTVRRGDNTLTVSLVLGPPDQP